MTQRTQLDPLVSPSITPRITMMTSLRAGGWEGVWGVHVLTGDGAQVEVVPDGLL